MMNTKKEPEIELTDGSPITPDHRELKENGQQKKNEIKVLLDLYAEFIFIVLAKRKLKYHNQ